MAAFEERMIALAGADAVKTAKQLLKHHRLAGAWRDRERLLCAIFRVPGEDEIFCKVHTGNEDMFSDCSRCGSGKLCAHGVAAVMYSGRFRLNPGDDAEPPSYYGGLRCQSLGQLAGRGQKKNAELCINAVCSSPHAPSKWENMVLNVRLKTAAKEYVGNQNNLRQLYFEKVLSVVLKFDDFSLHDQQLIRFLALNGEADNSNIMLSAEESAEFFHILPGFTRFFRQGKRITIHPERVEPVLARNGNRLSPALKIGNTVLPFAGARVIAGRAGCWVGSSDQYFFTGGSCETGFLRSFFRSPVQESAGVESFPLPVFKCGRLEPEVLRPAVLLDGCWLKEGGLKLHYDFLYRPAEGGGVLCAPGSGSYGFGDGVYWKRDREFEYAFEAELALFGFEIINSPGELQLTEVESAALFIDRVLPELIARNANVMLSGKLAELFNGGHGLPPVELQCRFDSRLPDGFKLQFQLSLSGTAINWAPVLENALNHGQLICACGSPGRIPAALGVFLRAAAGGMIRNIDPVGGTFEIPFCNTAYYISLATAVPGAMIPELSDMPVASESVVGKVFEFRGELRNYQKEGVAFMQFMADRNFNTLCADEMGLGKTVQLLALLASRMSAASPPALIVCPASLVANWEREAKRFVPALRTVAPQGGDRKAVIADPGSFDLLILSYTAARLANRELRKINFAYLVLDEAQHIKNPGSGNAKNCKDLRAAHRIVLTGTPLENSPEDLWSVMDFLQPGMLGTLPAFRKRYAGIAASAELQKDLALRIAPFVKRRTKNEVAADLPERSENLICCDFGDQQRALYDRILAEGRARIEASRSDERQCGAELFATLLRLRQACCHPALLPDGSGDGVPSAKSELLMELLLETIDSGHRILLFSQFTSMLKLLIPELEKSGIAFEYLDGSTRNRQQRIDNFNNNGDIPLFLLSLKAGGTGLNLTSADRVMIYDPWWNPAVELQAADRTHRIGQKRPVTISRLVVRESIEEKILSLQSRKRELFFNLVENPASVSGKMSLAELCKLLY